MNSRRYIFLILIVNLVIFASFIFLYANSDFPLIGHDFRLFIPRLLDTHLHYKVEGLSIQWYTPSFGGGLPAYANPLQSQFSLPQLLTWFIDPLNAVFISSILYAVIGFLGLYFFLKDALCLSNLTSVIGGMLFIGNGFFIERVVIGHVNFITYPLISIYLFSFLHPKIPIWISAALFAFTTSIFIYTGGVYIGVIGAFAMMITIPLVYLLNPTMISIRRLLFILLLGGLITTLIGGSKLYATSIYMANFPRVVRDNYSVTWITGLGGMIFQLIGVMTTTPFLAILGKSPMVLVGRLSHWTGTPYSFWELDSSLSPVLIGLVGLGAWNFLKKKPSLSFSRKNFIASILLISAIVLITQFSLAKGFFFNELSTLPVLKSLHANTRFTAAFILPLTILAAIVVDRWFKALKGINSFWTFFALDILVLGSLWTYFLLPSEVQLRNCESDIFFKTYEQIQAGDFMPVTRIIPEMNDYEVFLAGASNTTHHYEPLFRDENEAFHPLVTEGVILLSDNGFYNMTNPTGYLFPEQNKTVMYQLFRVSEESYLEEFLSRHQPAWEISPTQKLLDWTALLSTSLLTLLIFAYTGYNFINNWKITSRKINF